VITLIWLELQKIFKKWRTYIGFISIGLLTIIVQVSLYFTGERFITSMTHSLSDSFILFGNLFNGYLIANLILQGLIIHIPFLVVLVGGDLLASEATSGTYRMLLTRPVSRLKIVTVKFFTGIIYTVLLILFLAVLSLGVSLLIFGSGELISIRSKIIIFASNDVLWRFGGAYLYAALSMSMVMALSFFFSSMVENAIGPIVSTMAVIIIFLILSNIPVDFLVNIRPYFFTTHMTQWSSFFDDPVNYSEIFHSAWILLVHIVGLYIITTCIFLKKDILS
jgi:ABC-2 type transport system permease protein